MVNIDDTTPLLEVLRTPDMAFVRVSGNLDVSGAPRLGAVLDELFTERPVGIEVDLSGMTGLGTAGLKTLVAARRRWTDADRPFRLANPSSLAMRVLAVTGLRATFQIPLETGLAEPVVALV